MANGQKGLASDWNNEHVVDDDIDMGQYSLTDNVIENRTDMPAGPVEGQIIYRTDLNRLYIYNGAAWVPYITADGNTDFSANQSMGGFKLTNLSAGTAAADSVRYDQVIIKSGNWIWSCPGSAFIAQAPSIDPLLLEAGLSEPQGADVLLTTPVYLPLGATITEATVRGQAGTWTLNRINITTGASSLLGNQNVGAWDVTIADGYVDGGYGYYIEIDGVGNGQKIYGAQIVYTL